MKIKLGLDISQIAHGGGVATYTKNLADQLSQNPDIKARFFYSSLRKPYKDDLLNVKSFPLPPTLLEIFFNRFRVLPIETFIGNIDIFHSSDWLQPKTKAKKVTTYHDVVPLKYPQWSQPKIVEVHRRRLQIVEKEIDMVIAVSKSTKKDLLQISNIPEEKISVIYEGVGEQFKPQSEEKVEEFRSRLNLPKEFILAIGGIGERRNLSKVKEAAKGYDLVITGETISRVADEQLPLLYSAAQVLLYPSFYEGFGLPILEAQACGTPVITSNVSSMPEVAGDGAILVDPQNVEEISGAISSIVSHQSSDVRQSLIQKGFDNVKKFSWEKCAEETVQLYKDLLHE
ncbi:MAG: glycosyltransferase family 4 protein [Patescibacteria group bacterium]|nr:glycosyltransferase family 4 protein [Patescibacteria group bacterium]